MTNKITENKSNLAIEIEKILSQYQKGTLFPINNKLNPKIITALDELNQNHNTSWAIEMYRRNLDNLNGIALLYRGNKITYREMFDRAYSYAYTLKKLGYHKGSEIPACVTNIPEFVYLLLAVSFIGAKINVIGDRFDEKYLLSILNKTGSNHIFLSDELKCTSKMLDIIGASNINNIVVFSLEDSLPKDSGMQIGYDPYFVLEPQIIKNNVRSYRALSTKKVIAAVDFFEEVPKDLTTNVIARDVTLDDPFAITYTSGTTDPGCPKGVIHSNRSYITLSRFKENDVSGMPSMRNLTVLAHIPTYTHMELSCAISDTFYEKCTLALEPFYDKDFFLNSLLINKPNFVPASVGFWTEACDKLNFDSHYQKTKLPFLMIPTVTGEGISPGEEKYFNQTARKHSFGTAKLPFPLAPVTFSIGGGTSESSGIFVTLFKALQEKRLNSLVTGATLGLTPHRFAILEVLDTEGGYCPLGVPGRLVVEESSPCNMLSYTDEKLNSNIYITDKYGKKWLDMGTFSYKSDNKGRIKMKGRMGSLITLSDESTVPYYQIEDIILKDTKNIMSCTLVKITQNDKDYYVCHIAFQHNHKSSEVGILQNAAMRLAKSIPSEVLSSIYFRPRFTFPVAPSGKRGTGLLLQEGLTNNCIACDSLLPAKVKNHVLQLTKKD